MAAFSGSSLLVAAAALLVAASARASESYPETVEGALATPCPPACTTCHTRPEGGELTANTPVGISARRAGLECCNPNLLREVLATLETNATDSDMDGVPDMDELRAGTDPNAAEGKLECYVPPPDEGCATSARAARGSGALPWTFGVALALVAGAAARARGRRRQSQ
jgi:hypothetical protein